MKEDPSTEDTTPYIDLWPSYGYLMTAVSFCFVASLGLVCPSVVFVAIQGFLALVAGAAATFGKTRVRKLCALAIVVLCVSSAIFDVSNEVG